MTKETRRAIWLMCGLLLCSGCEASSRIRFPKLWYGSSAAAQRDYERHDPYPDSSGGPSAENFRPRNAQVQRSQPRRVRESTVSPNSAPEPTAP